MNLILPGFSIFFLLLSILMNQDYLTLKQKLIVTILFKVVYSSDILFAPLVTHQDIGFITCSVNKFDRNISWTE